MNRNHRSITIAAGVIAILLGGTACHGGSPTSSAYVPASTSQLPAGVQSAVRQSSTINASCKTPVAVRMNTDKTCHFNEAGYKGTFSIVEHLNGIAVVRPNKGTNKTPFVIRGLAPGSGSFDVNDTQGNTLNVPVVVPAAPIVSTCGKKIKIQIAGIVNCRFHESGYNGTFTIDSHLNGIASVSPNQGTSKTQFTVLGLVEGGGYFVVNGARKLRVQVLVTTL